MFNKKQGYNLFVSNHLPSNRCHGWLDKISFEALMRTWLQQIYVQQITLKSEIFQLLWGWILHLWGQGMKRRKRERMIQNLPIKHNFTLPMLFKADNLREGSWLYMWKQWFCCQSVPYIALNVKTFCNLHGMMGPHAKCTWCHLCFNIENQHVSRDSCSYASLPTCFHLKVSYDHSLKTKAESTFPLPENTTNSLTSWEHKHVAIAGQPGNQQGQTLSMSTVLRPLGRCLRSSFFDTSVTRTDFVSVTIFWNISATCHSSHIFMSLFCDLHQSWLETNCQQEIFSLCYLNRPSVAQMMQFKGHPEARSLTMLTTPDAISMDLV